MDEQEREAPPGFIVGTVNEPGYCEACQDKLRVGSRAALWSASAALFCIDCAKEGFGRTEQDDAVARALIALILTLTLLALIVWGLV